MDLLRKNIQTYKDLPQAVYHFSTKFRNEARARSGILRGREFMMKDLYSAHVSEEDMMDYYEKVKEAYKKIFSRLGFDFRVIEAAGGVFTDKNTHEFQVLAESGEDTIFYCPECDWGENKEIYNGKVGDLCPSCKEGKVDQSKSIEVGNIFPLGTFYAERMRVFYTDSDGKKKPVWFASYGIGPTRVLGTLVEVSHDEKGIIWFPQVAPFEAHLLNFGVDNKKANGIYKRLMDLGVDVLFDDRNVSAGEKLADCDLIGIPVRLVVSEKTGDGLEWKDRVSTETCLLSQDEVIEKLKAVYATEPKNGQDK
jgi:prolyl-tRNA synthetase